MPRDGSITPRDLVGKLHLLHVECLKCDRRGRYRLASIVNDIGLDGKLTNWLYVLTRDCPRRRSPGLFDPCAARMPNLLRLSRPSDE
jgi:hypothetical protein